MSSINSTHASAKPQRRNLTNRVLKKATGLKQFNKATKDRSAKNFNQHKVSTRNNMDVESVMSDFLNTSYSQSHPSEQPKFKELDSAEKVETVHKMRELIRTMGLVFNHVVPVREQTKKESYENKNVCDYEERWFDYARHVLNKSQQIINKQKGPANKCKELKKLVDMYTYVNPETQDERNSKTMDEGSLVKLSAFFDMKDPEAGVEYDFNNELTKNIKNYFQEKTDVSKISKIRKALNNTRRKQRNLRSNSSRQQKLQCLSKADFVTLAACSEMFTKQEAESIMSTNYTVKKSYNTVKYMAGDKVVSYTMLVSNDIITEQDMNNNKIKIVTEKHTYDAKFKNSSQQMQMKELAIQNAKLVLKQHSMENQARREKQEQIELQARLARQEREAQLEQQKQREYEEYLKLHEQLENYDGPFETANSNKPSIENLEENTDYADSDVDDVDDVDVLDE